MTIASSIATPNPKARVFFWRFNPARSQSRTF
jgi:hypothetical protein